MRESGFLVLSVAHGTLGLLAVFYAAFFYLVSCCASNVSRRVKNRERAATLLFFGSGLVLVALTKMASEGWYAEVVMLGMTYLVLASITLFVRYDTRNGRPSIPTQP